MKFTYRLLVLIGTALSILIMLGVTGDVTKILDFGSSRSDFKPDFVKINSKYSNPMVPDIPNHPQIFKNTGIEKKVIRNTSKLLVRENTLSGLRTITKSYEMQLTETTNGYKKYKSKPIIRMVLAVVCCGDRVNETQIMLKSAAALSHTPLMMIVFTEDYLMSVFKDMHESWPAEVQERATLDLHTISFPLGQDAAQWRKLFKPCAAQRLFMPSLLTEVDALVYVDTDVVFLAPLEELWRHFYAMNASHMAAMAPEHEDLATGWYNRFAKHPYYGRLGVNSGVMLMNLTRMRHFDWEEYVVPIYKHYRLAITWGDQDIINIIFHFHPDKLYVYGCEYNFRMDHCMYMSVCKAAERSGVFVLHGSRGIFHNKKQPAFKAVYRAWQEYKLGQDLRQDLYYPMQRYLLGTSNTTCGKIHNAFLKAMSSIVRLR